MFLEPSLYPSQAILQNFWHGSAAPAVFFIFDGPYNHFLQTTKYPAVINSMLQFMSHQKNLGYIKST